MGGEMIVAVPVESGEGLEAVRSAHFGHAAAFVLVLVADGDVTAVSTLVNPPHTHGGCMSIVNLLAANGVTVVTAAGMGGGPLHGLMTAGINVHFDATSATVGEAIEALTTGRTTLFGEDHVCRGH